MYPYKGREAIDLKGNWKVKFIVNKNLLKICKSQQPLHEKHTVIQDQ